MSLPAEEMTEEDRELAAAKELLGKTLAGRFRLDEVIGVGAMGTVFKALHEGLRKPVALKLIHERLTMQSEMVARFDREAAAASRLDHPHCVRVMDYGSENGRSFLVMEYLQGTDLSTLIKGPMDPARVMGLAGQMLEALAHAHDHGLIHRDIKPENIFVTTVAGKPHLKLLDFGIAKIQHGEGSNKLTQAGVIFGTPHFMSPEQATGAAIDARTDLYSLGIVLYTMLTGKLPYDGEDPVTVLRRQIRESLPPLPTSVPTALRDIVLKLTAKRPQERYESADAALVALREAAAPPKKKPRLPPPIPPPPSLGAPRVPTLDPGFIEAIDESDESPADAEAESSSGQEEVEAAAEPASDSSEESEAAESAEGSEDAAPADAGLRGATMRAEAQAAAAASARPARPRWLYPAIGGGLLTVALVIALSGGTESDSGKADIEASAPAKKDKAAPEASSPKHADQPAAAEDDEAADGGAGSDADMKIEEDTPQDTSRRALKANLASIDALIEARKYDAARITIGPLLEVYGDAPELHWRMGQVLMKMSPRKNAAAALESYQLALSLKPELIDDEAFAGVLWDLIDNPSLRIRATEVVIDLLGEAGYDRLVTWVNVQKKPLPYATRHAIIDHLAEGGQSERVNHPLQTALDLWQAQDAEDPCQAFTDALDVAKKHPDSFLWGTVARVPPPRPSPDAEPCAAEGLADLRGLYAERYAGLDPVVPVAYKRGRR